MREKENLLKDIQENRKEIKLIAFRVLDFSVSNLVINKEGRMDIKEKVSEVYEVEKHGKKNKVVRKIQTNRKLTH